MNTQSQPDGVDAAKPAPKQTKPQTKSQPKDIPAQGVMGSGGLTHGTHTDKNGTTVALP